MEKKLNEETENKTESIWSYIYDAALVFVSLIAFVAALITGEIILAIAGFVALIYVNTREIERKISKIEKKVYREEDSQ